MLKRAVLLFLLPLALHAEPLPQNACTQAVFAHTHLSEQTNDLSRDLNTLFVESQKDAYQLSMPLMIAGMLPDRALYTIIEYYMNIEMKKQEEEGTYTDWLRGRILLADYALHGKITRNDILIPLQRHVEFSKTSDNFMAWAAGYLAAVDYRYKDKMLSIVNEFTANQQAARSDKLWAWVLVLQAAGNARDTGTYLRALDQINAIGEKSSAGESLLNGLSSSSDYPAWAIAVARLAAANMGDTGYFEMLDGPMKQALKNTGRAEKLLAEVNNRLAIERNEALMACKGGEPISVEHCGH
jgi:hypothetical protein